MIKNESWDEEWELSEKLMPEIISILHKEFVKQGWGDPEITKADYDEDISHNTDLFAEFPNGQISCIAVRVRRYPKDRRTGEFSEKMFSNNATEITVRCSLAFNGKLHDGETEFQKMMNGWGDLICYCIAAPDEEHLASFFLGNMDCLREYARMEAQEFDVWKTVRTRNDSGRIHCRWNPNRMFTAGNTGCSFLVYKKEGPDAVPGINIADYKYMEVKS